MGVQSNIEQHFTCDNRACMRLKREHMVRRRGNDWPEPVLPDGWLDGGELGVYCDICAVALRAALKGFRRPRHDRPVRKMAKERRGGSS